MVECLAVIVVIVEVCEYGDFFENVEYYVVKECQGYIEGCLVELEDKLVCVEVIDVVKLGGDIVKFGVMVIVFDEDIEEESCYQVVGDDEVDVKEGKILIFFLIVCVMINKEVGDVVEVNVFGGLKFYEIVMVEWFQC